MSKGLFLGIRINGESSRREKLWLINLPALGYNFADDQPTGWVKAELRFDELLLTLSAIGGNKAEHDKTHSLRWLT